jgi:hypothetical protein
LVLVNQGSALQIIVAIVLIQLFIKLYGYYAPFDDGYVNVDAEFSQIQLFGIFFIALLIRTGKRYGFLSMWCCIVMSDVMSCNL